jgi:hypothetical protein
MANAEQVTEGQLAQFHVAVEKAFSDAFAISLQIDSSNEGFDWQSALPTSKVFFAAKPTRKSLIVESRNEERGGQKFLFGFSEPGAIVPLWVSWSEEWIKTKVASRGRQPIPMLDLIGVSVGFYAGYANKEKTQILRAEWDNPKARGNEAAQPHWHIDPNLIDLPSWSREQPIQRATANGLEELSAAEGTLVTLDPGFWSLQRLHLGMAGWKHRNDSPECWQHKLELDIIAEWLGRVLVYCKTELPRVTIAH